MLVAATTAALAARFIFIGKPGCASGHARDGAVLPSLEGTVCETIAMAPPAQAQGPLPSDPVLAAWTERVESVLEEFLALEAMGETRDRRSAPAERDVACARKLWTAIASKLHAEDRLRQDGERVASQLVVDGGIAVASASVPEAASAERRARLPAERTGQPECHDVESFLSAFPDNKRLRRALLVHFRPCVYDNFSSIDGALDKTEPFMRATTESWPERAGLDFELIVATDWTSQDPTSRTWDWLRRPFARITLDLGPTGNALRVIRDLKKQHPDVPEQLLPTARKQVGRAMATNRKARWAALVAYLEAGAPDPGDPPEPALVRALAGDERAARWALGYLPNELEEHAPKPFPFLRDPAVVRATAVRAELVATDEDRVLLFDALGQMPPGTGLAMMARSTSSANESVWRAVMAAIDGQIDQLPLKAKPGDLEAEQERRKHAATLLQPHLRALRAGLASHVCDHTDALAFLADANDAAIDAEVLPCVEGKPQPNVDFLQTLFHACLDHRDLGWVQTGRALFRTARSGDDGSYARRVAQGCQTGVDP